MKEFQIEKQNTETLKSLILLNLLQNSNNRDTEFIANYYGIFNSSLTLEEIGKNFNPPITRERVRQIIQNNINNYKENNKENNLFFKTTNFIKKELKLNNNNYIEFNDLIKLNFFSEFKDNSRGLIVILKECNFYHINYRNKIYFSFNNNKDFILLKIKKQNKENRRFITNLNHLKKSKTVTYIPESTRKYLIDLSKNNKNSMKLNFLYEKILLEYIESQSYLEKDFNFVKTQSWKSRQGKANWKQVGLYINKDIYNIVNQKIIQINRIKNINISIMSFICNAFIWHENQSKI